MDYAITHLTENQTSSDFPDAAHIHNAEGYCIKNRGRTLCTNRRKVKTEKITPSDVMGAALLFTVVACIIALLVGGTYKVFTIWF